MLNKRSNIIGFLFLLLCVFFLYFVKIDINNIVSVKGNEVYLYIVDLLLCAAGAYIFGYLSYLKFKEE